MTAENAPIRILVVDDEPLARQALIGLLGEDREVEVVGECANGAEAVAAIESLEPELVFLDVQMPELDGLGVVHAVGPESMPVVIFVTAYDRYALRAFEVHALDYLLKPFDDERFAQALSRGKAQVRQSAMEDVGRKLISMLSSHPTWGVGAVDAPRYLERIMVKGSGPIRFIKVRDITWIEAADYYVQIHAGGESHLLRESMRNLEQRLNPKGFMRIHRSAIVNLDRIVQLEPDAHGDYMVALECGTRVKLGRGRKDELQDRLMGMGPGAGE